MKTPKTFVPFSVKQKKLLTWWTDKSPYRNHDGIIAEGSVRSGKTVAMILSFVFWSRANFQNENFILAGKSMGALKRNVIKPMLKMLAALNIKAKYHRSADEPHISIGSNTYYLFGANNESSQDVLQGLTAAGSLLDEVALMPQSFVEQAVARCSVDGAKHFWNCNPESPYHPVKVDYIDRAEEKRFLILHFTMDDNPSLSEEVKERFKRLFTGLFYKRFILGLWVLAEGAVYDQFDEERHVVKEPDKIDLIRKSIIRHWTATDYGTGTVLCHGLFGQDREGRIYLLKTFWWDAKEQNRQKTDGEYAEDLRRLTEGVRPHFHIVPDDALSFIAELRRRGIGPIKIFKRDPGTVMRGIRNHANLLQSGRYFIIGDPSNKPVIEEYAAYVWDPKAQERGEDKPLKQHDHGKDMERYSTDTVAPNSFAGPISKPSGF